jgi:hypothetical protein
LLRHFRLQIVVRIFVTVYKSTLGLDLACAQGYTHPMKIDLKFELNSLSLGSNRQCSLATARGTPNCNLDLCNNVEGLFVPSPCLCARMQSIDLIHICIFTPRFHIGIPTVSVKYRIRLRLYGLRNRTVRPSDRFFTVTVTVRRFLISVGSHNDRC